MGGVSIYMYILIYVCGYENRYIHVCRCICVCIQRHIRLKGFREIQPFLLPCDPAAFAPFWSKESVPNPCIPGLAARLEAERKGLGFRRHLEFHIKGSKVSGPL